jgi:hypothetical protein
MSGIQSDQARSSEPSEATTATRRYRVIVRRDPPTLLAELSRDFDPLRDLVEIIADRRVEERRREARRPSVERRRGQRRYRPPRTWEEHGFLLTGWRPL